MNACYLFLTCMHVLHRFMDVTNTRAPGLGVCALGYKISLLSADVLSQCVWLMASVAVLSHSTMPQQLKGQEASAVWTFSSLPKSSHESHHTAEPTWEPLPQVTKPTNHTGQGMDGNPPLVMGRILMLRDRGLLAAGSLWKSSPRNSLQQCAAEGNPPWRKAGGMTDDPALSLEAACLRVAPGGTWRTTQLPLSMPCVAGAHLPFVLAFETAGF